MKVRQDFVTNSSSSSFIIAKNSNCTIDEIKDSITKNTNDIKNMLDMFDVESCECAVQNFISELAKKLFEEPSDLQLGDWIASATEYSNEDDKYGAFMYDYGYKLSTENFKVR